MIQPDRRRFGPDDPTVEIHARETRFRGFFRIDHFRLRHRLFNGEMSPLLSRELFERGHAAALLPYDPVRDEVVLVEQFRIGALDAPGGPWLLEIVAGVIEPGESAADVVRRESQEEAGVTVLALEPICDYLVSPGGASEIISLFCGRVDASRAGGLHGLAEEGEDIRVRAVPFREAWEMVSSGAIWSASPLIALQWLAMNRERVRAQWSA